MQAMDAGWFLSEGLLSKALGRSPAGRARGPVPGAMLAAALAAALAACGGPAGSGPAPLRGTVSLLLAETAADEAAPWAQVWVSLERVEALREGPEEGRFVLFDALADPAVRPRVVNLADPRGVADLVNAHRLPPGRYRVRLTLANQVTLVPAGGGPPVRARFEAGEGRLHEVTVEGGFRVLPGQVSVLGVGFDLARFAYDPASGLVRPRLVLRDGLSRALRAWARADLAGRVVAVQDSQHFTLRPRSGTADLRVTVGGAALVVLRRGPGAASGVVGDAAGLRPGDRVRVVGRYDAARLALEAVRVERLDPAAPPPGRLSGRVLGRDRAGRLLLEVEQASFPPPRATVAVELGSGAPILRPGQRLVLEGRWDGRLFRARRWEARPG